MKFKIKLNQIAKLSFNQFEAKFVKVFNVKSEPFLRFTLKFFPLKVINFITPKYLSALLANTYMYFEMYEKSQKVLSKALRCPYSFEYALSMKFDIERELFGFQNAQKMVEKFVCQKYFGSRELDAAIAWSFWNFSHKRFGNLLAILKDQNNELNSFDNLSDRYLPDFSKNLGHLSCLYLYLNYYSFKNDSRKINIFAGKADNEYYLKLIKRSSPYDICEISQKDFPVKNKLNYQKFDSLIYSFSTDGLLRIESDASQSFKQDYPEWFITYQNPLRLNEDENDFGNKVFKKTLANRKFIILHIRQSKGDFVKSQARDSEIQSYRKLCEFANSIGYLVVRMGDSRFEKLPPSFPAFDYAHSEMKSDFMDCWLWANAEFWVGNVNGAMLTALTFGRRRLVTNQWYWNIFGGPDDIYIPQLLEIDGKIQSIEETLKSELSRCMNRQYMKKFGARLRENSPDELLQGFKELVMNSSKSVLSDQVNNYFKNVLNIDKRNKGVMSISPSFAQKWYESLIIQK
jgi:putative glycosyltransferase (TIGR04372 family)